MKILFVSLAFPPKSDPEALQTAKYFHYLQRHEDLQIDVVTSAIPTLYMPYDADLEPYARGSRQLISIPLKENRYVNYALSKLKLDSLVFPDVKQRFHKSHKKVIRLLKEKPDLIYSRADPKSSTMLAYKLKLELKVPWILHMSDPWADCPAKQLAGSVYKKNNEWERKCLGSADLISMTSVSTIEYYKKKYPDLVDRFRLFPNVYDYDVNIQAYPVEGDTSKRKVRIIYTGGLAGKRSPGFLLEPLQELFQQDPAIAEKLEVIFAGDVDGANRAVFQKFNLPFVKWIGAVPFKEALRLQRWADYLVVIDNPIDDPAMSMFFPSKLLDYMLARKRILAITTLGSASHQVMKDLKGDVCSHGDAESIKKAVMRAIDAFQKGDLGYLINEKPPLKYEAQHNADRLYQEMTNLINVS